MIPCSSSRLPRKHYDETLIHTIEGLDLQGLPMPLLEFLRTRTNPSLWTWGGSGVEGSGVKLGGLSQNSTAMQLDPDRIHFKHNPSFDAERFINDPLLKAGFMNPRHLLLPSHQWPSVRRARVMCPREQLLKLFRKWDSVGCLALLNAKQSDPQYRCGLFAVYKNAEKDRQIFESYP